VRLYGGLVRITAKNGTSGLYYQHTTIVNYTSSVINKLKALLTDDARVVIYNRHVFIVQATGMFRVRSGKISCVQR